MISFERTFDMDLVRSILTNNPRSYRAMGDDACPPLSEFKVHEDERIWYVIPRDGEEVLGVFPFIPVNAVLYDVHLCILPAAWGGRSVPAFRGALDWMFENSPARRISGAVSAENRLAIKLALRCGMEIVGGHPKAFLKNGILHDVVLLGISPTAT